MCHRRPPISFGRVLVLSLSRVSRRGDNSDGLTHPSSLGTQAPLIHGLALVQVGKVADAREKAGARSGILGWSRSSGDASAPKTFTNPRPNGASAQGVQLAPAELKLVERSLFAVPRVRNLGLQLAEERLAVPRPADCYA